jgi:hypothetical protein
VSTARKVWRNLNLSAGLSPRRKKGRRPRVSLHPSGATCHLRSGRTAKFPTTALTHADVGVAIGAGTDVAIESADVVLMKNDPFDVVGAIELSRATLRKMHQNLWWAVGYNVVAFPFAAGVFYPILLGPTIAAITMSGSTAIVAVNALMLKRTRLAGIRHQRPG